LFIDDRRVFRALIEGVVCDGLVFFDVVIRELLGLGGESFFGFLTRNHVTRYSACGTEPCGCESGFDGSDFECFFIHGLVPL